MAKKSSLPPGWSKVKIGTTYHYFTPSGQELTTRQYQEQVLHPKKEEQKTFYVKKGEELAHYQIYVMKTKNLDDAIRAYGLSNKARSLKPQYIRIAAKGTPTTNYEDDNPRAKYQWRTVLPNTNPDDFMGNPQRLRKAASQNVFQMFEGNPVEYHVVMYVRKGE